MTLQAIGLTLVRGRRTLFQALDLAVQPGEALRIAGSNGSGKTSLLRLLCGLAQPLQGQVLWRGQSIVRHREAFHLALRHVGHGHGLKDDLTAWENFQTAALLAGRPCTRQQALDALAALGLEGRANLPARALSQGQRRRVLLAGLALPSVPKNEPRLLVLDEPFVALDQASISLLCTLLNQQLAAGAVLVYTTHQAQALHASRHLEITLGELHGQPLLATAEAS